MLSLLLGTTTITMNRGEQETLYNQARNLRLHQESKAQHNSSQPRHHSYGNIHQIHSTTSVNFPKQVLNYRNAFGNEQRPCDDLVLSVLKSPLRDQSVLSNLSSIAATSETSVSVEGGKCDRLSTVTTLTTATVDNVSGPQGVGRDYTTLQTSEDDLADDVESALETTELNSDLKDQFNNPELSPYGLKFLRRFRTPKFEAHHRRVPTPMRRKTNRSKSTADILDGVIEPNPDEPDEVAIENGAAEGVEGGEFLKL
jgi:hypothetical protein